LEKCTKYYFYFTLDGEPRGNRLLGKPTHKWKDNINIDVKEEGLKE
jgi:hypothetical protein